MQQHLLWPALLRWTLPVLALPSVALPVLGLTCALAGCGGTQAEAKAPPPPAPEPMPEPKRAVEVTSDASDALRSISSDATLIVRLRGDRLRAGPALAAITGLRQAIPQVRQGLTLAQAACGFDPAESIQEIVVGGQHQHTEDPQEPLGRVRIDPRSLNAAILLDRPAEEALTCIRNFVPVTPTEIGNDQALILPTGGVLMAHDELLVYSPEGQAEAAKQRIESGSALNAGLQATLDSSPDAVLLSYGQGNNALGLSWASLTVSQAGGGIQVKGVGLAESPDQAARVKQRVLEQLAQVKKVIQARGMAGDAPKQVANVLDQVKVENNGNSLSLLLELDKAQADEFFSTVVVALAQQGLEQYTAAAKTAEARDNVMRIALALSDYARANPAPKRRFPKSAPAAPAQVPGRTAVAPQGFEHPSWQAIRFAPREPLLYSYEFVTAPDGNSVEVIAHGDLDGDGQLSKYAVKVTIEGKDPKIDARMTRENPYE